MEAVRLKVSDRMRALMAYPKLAGATPRMLVLESNYWLDTACLNAAQTMGWEIARVPVVAEGKMPRNMVAAMLNTLTEFRPDFVLSINLSAMDEQGLFAGLFADLAIPYVTWFVDDPRTILMGRNIYGSDFAVAFTWEAAYVPYLEACGFAEVYPLPLAVDRLIFNAEPAEHCVYPPTFVGNSMTEFAAREWTWVEQHPALAQALHDAFDAGRVTRENFGLGLAALLGLPALDAFDPHEQRHAELVCFIEGTRRLRLATIQALESDGLAVRGDEAWREHTAQWGPYLNYTRELPGFYRECEVNLNITSIQMPTTVNQRVFDCPAAGGFLLTDAQSALDELFDLESEIACYHSIEECRELLRFYRGHPEARRALIERARKRILGGHTYAHRLQQIVEVVRRRFGG